MAEKTTDGNNGNNGWTTLYRSTWFYKRFKYYRKPTSKRVSQVPEQERMRNDHRRLTDCQRTVAIDVGASFALEQERLS